jgi:hypothetical protein
MCAERSNNFIQREREVDDTPNKRVLQCKKRPTAKQRETSKNTPNGPQKNCNTTFTLQKEEKLKVCQKNSCIAGQQKPC